MADQRSGGFGAEPSRDTAMILLLVIGLLIVLPMLFMGGMMGPWMMGWRTVGWRWSPFFVLLLIIGIALVVRTALRRGQPEGPLDLLKLRLARGEITPSEYEELKRILQAGNSFPAKDR